jgi:hypothetical protein
LFIIAAGTFSSAWAQSRTTNYAVTRNGEPIGTSTLRLDRNGAQTTAEIATHVQVKIAYITVYRYDQTETEHWDNGKLVGLSAATNDNGTLHKVSAARRGNALAVDADGKISEMDPSVIPVSLWNAALVRQRLALDPQDGSLTPVSVVDHGNEDVVLQGRPTPAHHYSIATTFPQDVWYDANHQLIRVELRGSDGSKIQYQPG